MKPATHAPVTSNKLLCDEFVGPIYAAIISGFGHCAGT
jgi:hypothetical protein